MKIEGLTISESVYNLEGNRYGKLAAFIYNGCHDPIEIIEHAIKEYVKGNDYYDLMMTSHDNPWTRVIITNINDIHQEEFDTDIHSIDNASTIRNFKIDKIVD